MGSRLQFALLLFSPQQHARAKERIKSNTDQHYRQRRMAPTPDVVPRPAVIHESIDRQATQREHHGECNGVGGDCLGVPRKDGDIDAEIVAAVGDRTLVTASACECDLASAMCRASAASCSSSVSIPRQRSRSFLSPSPSGTTPSSAVQPCGTMTAVKATIVLTKTKKAAPAYCPATMLRARICRSAKKRQQEKEVVKIGRGEHHHTDADQ
jgi:hypothetical protein